jgi:hypothetical protein
MAIGRVKKTSKEINTIIFEEVLEKLLSYCGKDLSYTEENPNWRKDLFISGEDQKEWMEWGAYHISKYRSMKLELAKEEMDFIWFNWGIRAK